MTQSATKPARKIKETAYEKWMTAQEIPIHRG